MQSTLFVITTTSFLHESLICLSIPHLYLIYLALSLLNRYSLGLVNLVHDYQSFLAPPGPGAFRTLTDPPESLTNMSSDA